ncbi:Alpha/Beta hydrolase protein [Diplogelasinospora grovesii]|uniref:Alpha/Beta hydrolase protein n=1 Tax=Diplogelasinospora grovesii TaxID=303347 RepID=A0AAN6S580_9PEZI|nr:Alpha/Beta hydrolase protein [Diplogelasinospora grovesii]
MSCPDCYSGHVHSGTPRGTIEKLHGLDTYVTQPSDATKPVKGIIVIIPDAFGWEFVNNRILADNYADKGSYRVLLPDFMFGHAAPVWLLNSMKVVTGKDSSYLAKAWKIPGVVYGFASFLFFNRPGRRYPIVKAFFRALRAANPEMHVGAAGFCWGGKHTVLLAADPEMTVDSGKPLIDCGFAGHPSMLSIPGDIEKMHRPVSFACPENDPQVSLAQAEIIKKIVEGRTGESRGEVVVYENCGHGFCVRADTTNDDVARQAAEAEDQCIRWMQSHF